MIMKILRNRSHKSATRPEPQPNESIIWFEVFRAVTIKLTTFWNAIPASRTISNFRVSRDIIQCHCRRGFELMTGFNGLFATARDYTLHYYTHSNVHSHVFSSRRLVAVSNGWRSLSFGFPNYPRLQLSASKRNRSQCLNSSSLFN
jgi:hypothetical protein